MIRNFISRVGNYFDRSSVFWDSEFGLTVKWFVIIYFIFCPIVAYIINQCIN